MSKQSKAARIRKYLAQGKSAKEVAALVGVKPQYVHGVTYYEKKKALAPKRKPGRPRKVLVEAITPKEAEMMPVGGWTLTAKYEAPRLTWRQRMSALFTGRI